MPRPNLPSSTAAANPPRLGNRPTAHAANPRLAAKPGRTPSTDDRPMLNLAIILEDTARARPHKTAFAFGDKRFQLQGDQPSR